jgi:oligopeptide/dipeptide ABC transporter ATP-binding protein
MTNTGSSNEVLRVEHLSVSTGLASRPTELVHDVSFHILKDEVVVLLGESGCGKTILSRSITRLFTITAPMVVTGSVRFEDTPILEVSDAELTQIRREKIRYVFQDPMSSLNPLARIGTQMKLASNRPKDKASLHNALNAVGLTNTSEVLTLYPHQLSGGMAQRVCIAMAIVPSPALLIADEPTSSVDASLKYMVLDLLLSIQKKEGMALLLITHDLDVVRAYGDRVLVMYGGRIIESASKQDFFKTPLHPYSKMLIDSQVVTSTPETIQAGGTRDDVREACRFINRCPHEQDKCRRMEPDLEQVAQKREVRCFYWK